MGIDNFDVAQGRDPYFDPPAPQPGRNSPFLDGSPDPTKPNERPTVVPRPDEKWVKPETTPKWTDPQPYRSGGRTNVAELELQLKQKERELLAARDYQRGSDAAKGIISGTTTGLFSEPLAKSLRMEIPVEPKLMGRTIQNVKTGFVTTLVTGTILSADEAIRDRIYEKNANSWGLSSLTVPLSLTMGKGLVAKSLLTAGAVGAGHVVDLGLPAPDWVPKSLKHFTVFDGITIGLAATLPSKSRMMKAGMMGLAWLAGNVAEEALTPPSAGDLEKIAEAAGKKDKTERSYASMSDAVSKYRELGKKNEVVLEHDLAALYVDAQKNYQRWGRDEKLGSHRSMLSITKALGDHHLEKGTRLSVTETNTPTYILGGMNLDLGGDALTYLHMARNSVKGSKSLTEMQMNTFVNDTRVTPEESADIDKMGADVDKSINAIMGKHDITGAVDKLVKFIDKGTVSSTQAIFNKEAAFYKTFFVEIDKKLARNLTQIQTPDGKPNPDAITISAKLLRDQALIQLAFTKYKLETGNKSNLGEAEGALFGDDRARNRPLPGTNKPKGYDGAIQTLQMAEKLAPDHPDLAELKAIAQDLADQIKARKNEQ